MAATHGHFCSLFLDSAASGFDTYYVEYLYSKDCEDDNGRKPTPFVASANARYFRTLMDRFDLSDHATLLEWEGSGHVGLCRSELEKLAPDIDLFVNYSGRFRLKSILDRVRRRMYIDGDPGYTQIWQEQYGVDMNLRGHDVYVTVGLNLGQPDCPLPTCGIRWETTLPPVCALRVDDHQSSWVARIPPSPIGAGTVRWNGREFGIVRKQMNSCGSSNFPNAYPSR